MERPHPCGRAAGILPARYFFRKSRTTKWPVFWLTTQICFHGIHFNVLNSSRELSRISNVPIEIFFLPKTARTPQHSVCFTRGK
jgi:hypothetical protein